MKEKRGKGGGGVSFSTSVEANHLTVRERGSNFVHQIHSLTSSVDESYLTGLQLGGKSGGYI